MGGRVRLLRGAEAAPGHMNTHAPTPGSGRGRARQAEPAVVAAPTRGINGPVAGYALDLLADFFGRPPERGLPTAGATGMEAANLSSSTRSTKALRLTPRPSAWQASTRCSSGRIRSRNFPE